MDRQQIIDYIMHTPSNTNPAMLGQFLDEYSGGSGESWNTLFEGEITTEEQNGMYFTRLSTSDYIDANKIKVTFNGVEYVCDKIVSEEENIYGAGFNEEYEVDFSNYPFVISSTMSDGVEADIIATMIATESPGTYSIKIEVPQESGGSGDWSTAEVTFINYTVISGTVRCATIYQDSLCIDTVTIPSANDKQEPAYGIITHLIPLYKNQYILSFLDDFSEDFTGTLTTISGNIVENEYKTEYLITGDCTITFNANDSAPVTPAQ